MADLDTVLRRTGLTYRQLDHWATKGYLQPEGGEGSGRVRYWPEREVQVAAAMKRYVDAGLTPKAAHEAARNDGVVGGYRVELVAVAA